VNGQPADAGCYIEGSWGQYGPDRVATVAEQFGLEIGDDRDPRVWRELADSLEAEGSHADENQAWERYMEAAEEIEQRLNMVTEGGYWTWEDGEFFLVQTEVEGIVFVPVDDDATYDDAWRMLVEGGLELAVSNYDDLQSGQRAFRFVATVRYVPDEQPEQWTDNEIARGLDN
jgi:hypothetical protein